MTQLAAHMVKIAPEQNQYRYYAMTVMPTLFGDWSLVREWGRIGRAGRRYIEHHPTEQAAIVSLLKWKQAKAHRGYEG